MKSILITLIALFCLSCADNSEIKTLKENQAKLETRITKLESDMKEQMKIDSVLIQMYKQNQGSLLDELKK